MRTSTEDLLEDLFEARFNKLIKARPNTGRQYEESRSMYMAANPPPKVLCLSRIKVQFFGFLAFMSAAYCVLCTRFPEFPPPVLPL